jgi:GNAT superfamily N-acetyltransferase
MSSVGIHVRAIAREDLPRVWELVRGLAAFEKLEHALTGSMEELAAGLFAEPVRIEGLVAGEPGRIRGYALFHPTYSSFRTRARLWLEDLFVEESARGQGVGEALFQRLCRIALERGCYRVEWDVLDWNPARGFYERMGAEESEPGWRKFALDAAGMRTVLERRPRAAGDRGR